MPAQSVWMIRLSLAWLFLATLIGSILLVHKAVELHPVMWSLLPLHFETAIWGWAVQLAMGTAYWIFPRHLVGTKRGPEKPVWWVLILFNTGLITLLAGYLHQSVLLLKLTGRGVMTFAVIIFGILMWSRVKSYSSHTH
jgi:hypothetical protein